MPRSDVSARIYDFKVGAFLVSEFVPSYAADTAEAKRWDRVPKAPSKAQARQLIEIV